MHAPVLLPAAEQPIAVRSYRRAERVSADDRQRVIDGLSRSMPSYNVAQYFLLKSELFDDHDILLVAELDGAEVIALFSAVWKDAENLRFLFIQTMLISEQWHRTAVLRLLWRRLFEDLLAQGQFPSIIVFKTYNPKSFAAMANFASVPGAVIYPSLWSDSIDQRILDAVRKIAATLAPDCEFDQATGVLRGGAGGVEFYRSMPPTAKPEIHDHFKRHVTPADRVLCCLFIESVSAQQQIRRAFRVKAPTT